MSLRSLVRSTVAAITLCIAPAIALGQNSQGPTDGLPQSLAATRITRAIDDTKLVTLRGNVNPLAQARYDRGMAPVSMATGKIVLVLQGSQQQQNALKQYLDSVQDPGSAAYRKWLTPQQFGLLFGPTTQDIQTVTGWLQSQGFEVRQVSPARTFVEFSGSIGQVNTAFHTSIHRYNINGQEHIANATDPQIPVALAPVVAGVAQLSDFYPRTHAQKSSPAHWDGPAKRIKPDLTLQDNNGNNYLYVVPADAAVIYDTPNAKLNTKYTGTSYDGTGITIGIAGDSNITLPDVGNYRTAFLNEGSNPKLPTVIVDGNDPGINGDEIEGLLDTQVAGGIAPGATINFYTSADEDLQSGLFLAIIRALDDNQVSILNVSFGACEANQGASGNQFINQLWQQAAAQGISVTVSAGDSGSAGCDSPYAETVATHGLAVNGLASTPYNIAVGGTDYPVLQSSTTSFSQYVNTSTGGSAPYYGSALSYIPEAPWNDSTSTNTTIAANTANKDSNGNTNIIGAGGGISAHAVCNFSIDPSTGACSGNTLGYPKPAFQSGLTPNDNVRDLPDISLLAADGMYSATWTVCLDPSAGSQGTDCLLTNGQISQNTTFSGVGGTSAAAPAFAGMLALIAQSQGGARLGQADTILYALAKSKYSTAFHDVTTGNNSVVCSGGVTANCGSNGFLTGYDTTSGYDTASGLGSIDVAQLASNWSSVSFTPTSTNLTLNGSTSALTITHGTVVNFAANVTPGTATGNVMLETSSNLPNQGVQPPVLTLNNGAVNGTYNGLPGGSYNVYAYYGGDAGDAASTSNKIAVTVSPENSTTTLAGNFYDAATGKTTTTITGASSSAIPYGSYAYFHATPYGNASPTVNGKVQPDGIPTGTVAFSNAPSPFSNITSLLNTVPINSQGDAVYSVTTLSPATYSITGSYSGDPGLNASTSNAVGFTITKAVTTTTVSPASSNIQSNASAVLTVTITSDSVGAQPTGTITVTDSGKAVASTSAFNAGYNQSNGTVAPTAQITVPGTALASGANTLTISYSGDGNYGGSSTTSMVTISATGTGSSFSVAGTNVTLSAGSTVPSTITVTPANGFTGQVNLTCSVANPLSQQNIPGCNFGGKPTGSVTLSGTGAATTQMTITTTANTGANHFPLDDYFNAAGGTMLACVLIFAVPARRRSWRTMLGLLVVIVSLAGLGCGTNGNGPPSGGTRAGNYSVTVTGTDAATGKITSNATITVTVQ